MTEKKAKNAVNLAATRKGETAQPDWANGLRQLYDNVVAEPLPDAFAELLSKLDSKS